MNAQLPQDDKAVPTDHIVGPSGLGKTGSLLPPGTLFVHLSNEPPTPGTAIATAAMTRIAGEETVQQNLRLRTHLKSGLQALEELGLGDDTTESST